MSYQASAVGFPPPSNKDDAAAAASAHASAHAHASTSAPRCFRLPTLWEEQNLTRPPESLSSTLLHHMFSRSSNKNNGSSGSGFGRDYRGFLDISRLGSSDSRSQRAARKKREEDWNSTYSGSSSPYPEKSKLAPKVTIPDQPRRMTSYYHSYHYLPTTHFRLTRSLHNSSCLLLPRPYYF